MHERRRDYYKAFSRQNVLMGEKNMYEFIKEKELDQALLDLIISKKKFEERFLEIVIKQLENESSMFLFNYKWELDYLNGFKVLEDLHVFNEDIKAIYLKGITLFNKNLDRFLSEEIKELLSGIIWNLEDLIEKYPPQQENKIELERIKVTGFAIENMKSLLLKEIQMFISESHSEDYIEYSIDKAAKLLIEYIFDNKGKEIQDIHQASIKALNILERRKALNTGIMFVSTAKKQLEAYNSINPEVFHERIKNNADMEIFTNIITVIKELYLRLEEKEKEIYTIVNSANISTAMIEESFLRLKNQEEMIGNLSDNPEFISVITEYKEHKSVVLKELNISIFDEIKKSITLTVNSIKKESRGFEFLSCHIVQELKEINKKLGKIDANLIENDEERKMIKSLIETIKLKYETVKEKDSCYLLGKKEDFVKFEKQLLDFSVNFQSNINQYFNKLIMESKAYFMEIQEKYNLETEKLLQYNLMKDIQFLREELINEVITLEELVKYSLPKLAKYREENAKAMNFHIKNGYKRIEKNLQLAGIEKIEPLIKEKFNGKEQQVIMIEEAKGLDKGEIVSVHTKGYKLKEYILARANVVVAG